jgi:glutathionylspermidine synthase
VTLALGESSAPLEASAVAVEPLACKDPLALPSFETRLQHEWLVWDGWVAGKRRVDLHPLVLSARAHAAAVRTATTAWSLVKDAADRAFSDPTERARYRLHADVERLACAAREAGDTGVIARVDLLLHEDGRFVACEVNADCPGGYNETLALPRLAREAGLRRGVDPTHVAARLADMLVERSGGPGSPRGLVALVYATAYAEDLQVCALLERLVLERGGRAVRAAPTALAPAGGGVGIRGEKVAVLYRYYPLEFMAGQRNIDSIARATAAGSLSSISSFSAIYAQSKLAMARATMHDPARAAEAFPETRALSEVSAERLEAEREKWVVKRDLSRVGDHVFVGALMTAEDFRYLLADIAAAEADPRPADACGQVWIAQRYVPQRALATPWGPHLLTLGVYLVDGAFAGYFARLSSDSCCSHDALVLPVFLRDGERSEDVRPAAAEEAA